jgi:Ser/Thr protein kinase RdoA (MazF antagonist)
VQGHACVVAKFYRPGRWSEAQILEEHAFAAELMAAEVPAVGPLRLQAAACTTAGFAFGLAAARRRPRARRPRGAGMDRPLSGPAAPGGRAPALCARPALDARSFGHEALHSSLRADIVPADALGPWRAACEQALARIAQHPLVASDGGFDGQKIELIRLHGDCHPGNILWTPGEGPGRPHFVDLDDARSGPAVQDLWMLLSGERAATRQLGALIDGYEQVREFDRRELGLIEPLRTLRLIHYSAWLASRWDDPTFPMHFRGSAAATTGTARPICCTTS